MEYRTLEINLQYAKDLNNVNFITKMDVYAVVSISGGDKNSKQKTKTPVDRDGGSNPTWNFPIKFTVDEAALQQNRLALEFKLICDRALGDKDVGEVHVPIKELLDSSAKGKKFVSYQVRKPTGKPKGQLTFTYQISDKTVSAAIAPPTPMSEKGDGEPVVAYPAGPSSAYPPHLPGGYPAPPPPGYGYPPPPPPHGYGYPPPPPPHGYGYPTPPPPHGYGYPPPPGYGYQQQEPKKKNKFGMGLGAGLLGGAIGGLLVGDMISDAADFDCGGGFDF